MQGFNAEKQYQELPADDGYDETQDLKTFIRSRFIVGDPSDWHRTDPNSSQPAEP